MSNIISEDEGGIRLDRWFKRHFPALPHGDLQRLLRTGQVRVDGRRAEAGLRLEAGQTVRLPPQLPDPNVVTSDGADVAAMRDLRPLVIYEDDDVVAINKPPGLAVQGGTGIRESVDSSLMTLSRDGRAKPKLVHRLDRDTGGVLLLARTTYAATVLAESFRQRDTQKIYLAVTIGVPAPDAGCIEASLMRRGEKVTVVDDEAAVNSQEEESRYAKTFYAVTDKTENRAALVELRPVTGRTHQLRVHLAYIGTPILGDRLYCSPDLAANSGLPIAHLGRGLHLAARQIILPHPRRGILDITAPISSAMLKTLQQLGLAHKAYLSTTSE